MRHLAMLLLLALPCKAAACPAETLPLLLCGALLRTAVWVGSLPEARPIQSSPATNIQVAEHEVELCLRPQPVTGPGNQPCAAHARWTVAGTLAAEHNCLK